MQILQFPFNPKEINHFFFCAQFKHKNTLYSVAVGETILYSGDPSDGYTVLLVSEQGTITFEMQKDQEENWAAGDDSIPQELVYIIGAEIDKEQAKNAEWSQGLNNGL